MSASHFEIEEAIRTIYAAESRVSRGGQWIEDCRNELRPPASREAIQRCERFLGREFSPSYRNFLTLHDGWLGCLSGCQLLGVIDYQANPVARESMAVALYTQLLYSVDMDQQAWVPDVRSGLYAPERFYRFIDAPASLDVPWPRLKNLIDNFEAQHGRLLHAGHTLIGLGQDTIIVLDRNTRRPDGEMDVVCWNEGSEERWGSFGNMLNDIALSYTDGVTDSVLEREVARHGIGTI